MFLSVIGKTAFANTLVGRSFEDTPSTVGINELKCDIKYASVGQGNWSEYDKPDKEMEVAIAAMIANGFTAQSADEIKAKDSETTANAPPSTSSPELPEARASRVTVSETQERAVRDSVTSASAAIDRALMDDTGLGKYMEEGENGYSGGAEKGSVTLSAEDAKRFDDEFVMRCLADKMKTDSKFVISVFDFGGQSVFNVSLLTTHVLPNYISALLPYIQCR